MIFILAVLLAQFAHRSNPGSPSSSTVPLTTNGTCQVVSSGGTNSAMFAVTGTWTGTLGFFGTNDLGATTVALQAYPVTPGTGALGASSVNTTTGNGVWIADTFGMYSTEVCATAAMTGAALLRIDADPASAVVQVTGVGGAAVQVSGSLSVSGAADVVSTGAPTTFNANSICTGALLTAGLQSAGFHFDVGTLVGTFTAQCSAFISGTTNFTTGGLKDVTGATVSGAVANPNAQTDWTITCPGDTRRVQVCTTAFTSGSTTGQAVGTFYQTASAAAGGGGGVVTQPTAANLNATVFGTLTCNAGTGTLATSLASLPALPANQSINEAQINGVAPSMGNGVSGPGVQRVTIASDSTGQVNVANTVNAQGLGTAGAPSGGVLTCQPPASGGTVQPVSGTVTANAADHSNATSTLSTACTATTGCASTAAINWATNGLQSGGFDITATATPAGYTLACDTSTDGGVTYILATCNIRSATNGAQKGTVLANADLTTGSKWVAYWDGAPDHIQIRSATAGPTGTFAVRSNATFAPAAPPQIAHNIALGMPQDASGNALLTPIGGADQTTATTPRQLTFATASTAPLATAPAVIIAESPNSLGCAGQKVTTTNFKPVNITTGTQLITGTAAQNVYICSLDLVVGAADNVALVEGTGTVCATGIAGLAGGTTAATGWNFAANGGLTKGDGFHAQFKTATQADNVCLLVSGAAQVSGSVTWVSF